MGLEYKYSAKTLQLANKIAGKKLNPQWNFLAAKRQGWTGGRDDSSIYLFLAGGEIGEEMRAEATRLRLTLL